MINGFVSRLRHGWNAFMNRDPTYKADYGASYAYRPDRTRFSRNNERSIATAVYNRIAMDVAAVDIKHVRIDSNGRYMEDIKSGLNWCLTTEANIDQTSRAFIQDAVISLLDEGCIALVPVDTNVDITAENAFDILSLRVGKIIQWYPEFVKVNVYNDKTGRKEDVTLPKRSVGIVENPLYSIINERNSTMQRLLRKMNLIDLIDEQIGSGKLDLIVQLPYIVKTETRKQQALQRRKDIEDQLTNSKFGIAYIDGTEHVTQLNRPVENNLMAQIEYLTNLLYSQLGITQAVLDGTADEKTMLNYYNRTIEPIVSALVDEMRRKFLTKTARTQGQSILFFRDPFKLVPINNIAEIADKFTRNEIMTSNEIRQITGLKPSKDPKADQLINSNISQPKDGDDGTGIEGLLGDQFQNEPLDAEEQLAEIEAQNEELDELERMLEHSEDDLTHYASPYYDPVKAHEYYEAHKKLKGRKSTKGLNDEGKKAASYVKEQLNAEKKQKIQVHKDQTNSAVKSNTENMKTAIKSDSEAVKSQIKQQTEQNKAKIEQLRDYLYDLDSDQKEAVKERVYAQIDQMRATNKESAKALRASLKEKNTSRREQNKSANTGLRTAHKEYVAKVKQEYEDKYISELDAMKGDKSFKAKRKRRSSSSD